MTEIVQQNHYLVGAPYKHSFWGMCTYMGKITLNDGRISHIFAASRFHENSTDCFAMPIAEGDTYVQRNISEVF
jgi:hypothetical protein